MTVTVTENFTEIDGADSLTGWTTTSGAVYTGFQREDSGNLGDQASEGFEDPYFTQSSTDFSDVTVFGWCRSGNPDIKANDGFGIILGDGTDQIAYTVGGSDDAGHAVLLWSQYKMDCAIRDTTAGDHRVLAGTEANLTFTAITEVGYGLSYLSKALGNADNVFWDILKYIANGSAALTISGGTTGARGTLAEIVTIDIGTGNLIAYGILRELVGAKAYELFYGIEYGHATADTFFEDSDFQLYIQGPDMTDGNMDVDLVGGTGTNLFNISNFVIVSIGTRSNWDLSDTNYDTMNCTDGEFVDCGTFTLPVDSANKSTTGLTFTRCLQVDASLGPDLSEGSILVSDVAADTSALLWNVNLDPDGELDDMTFTIGANAHHAIEFGLLSPLTMTLTGQTFTGFNASNAQNDSTFHIKRTSGTVTINLVGVSGNTSYRTDGATVNVVASVPVTVTATFGGTPVEGAAVYLETSGADVVLNGLTNASGVLSGSFSGTTPVGIDSDVSGVKSSSGPIPYGYFTLGGTIEAGTGYTVTALLVED